MQAGRLRCTRRHDHRIALPISVALFATSHALVAQAPSIRDSSGVVIVQNGPINNRPAFEIASRPTCVIRGNSGKAESDLTSVPSGFLLPDKTIVVAEARAREMRFYRCDGTLIRKFGRAGSGPGEFQNLAAAWRWKGDTILVSQLQSGSLVVVHALSGFVRTIPLRGNVSCCFNDGSVLVSRVVSDRSPPDSRQNSEIQRFPLAFEHYVLSTEAISRGQVLVVPGNETMGESRASSPASAGVTLTRRTIRAAPFGRLTSVRPSSASIVVGEGNGFEVRLLSLEGRTKTIIRAQHAPTRLTPSDVQAYKSEQTADLQGQAREASLQALESLPFPRELPPYRRVEVDEIGRIWLELYRLPRDKAQTWVVLDRNGAQLGRVALPRDSRVLWIGSDEIVLRQSDDEGFVTVAVYRLEKPGA